MTNDGPASTAQCLYCFEVLSAHFEGTEPPELSKVTQLYDEYTSNHSKLDAADGTNATLSPPVDQASLASGSTTTTATPSSGSEGVRSASRSPMSLSSPEAEYPVYVTWNTLSSRNGRSGGKALRGCIGTFEALPLATGLRRYTLVSALEDYRFSPITASLLPALGCELTLLSAFEECRGGPLDWNIGTHGIKISFVWRGRRLGATYLPHVCPEQGWSKEECFESLMQKAGWEPSGHQRRGVFSSWRSGSGKGSSGGDADANDDDDDAGIKKPWETVTDLKVVRYQGAHAAATYAEWQDWRAWVKDRV